MSDGTMQPAADNVSVCDFDVEYTTSIKTGQYRHSVKLTDFPRVATLRTLFASVTVVRLVAEARQEAMEGTENGQLLAQGHIYIAVIPTSKDTESHSGSTAAIVNNVPNKQTFPLSCTSQSNQLFNFNLQSYEVDLAMDPRRGAGPVAWIGNSGVKLYGDSKASAVIASVTWRLTVRCTGSTPLWQ